MAIVKTNPVSGFSQMQHPIDEELEEEMSQKSVDGKQGAKFRISEHELQLSRRFKGQESYNQERVQSKIYSLESGVRAGRLSDSSKRYARDHELTSRTRSNARNANQSEPYASASDPAEHSTRLSCLKQEQPQSDSRAMQTQNYHHKHGPSCSLRLVCADPAPRIKQHQPHCIHHDANHKRIQPQAHHHQHQHQPTRLVNVEAVSSETAAHEIKLKPVKHLRQQDKSYLLVECRPPQPDLRAPPSNSNRGHLNGRADGRYQRGPAIVYKEKATIKFISQLYFLLHLSAIFSLLLHHKNLVANERRPIQQWAIAALGPFQDANSQHSNISLSGSQQVISESANIMEAVNQLPLPQAIHLNEPRSSSQRINSVVASESSKASTRGNQSRFGREAEREPSRLALANSDILVRLVGYRHAKCALQYFLCYLLSSSVTILVCLRLFKMCDGWQTERRPGREGRTSEESRARGRTGASLDTCGFYYRTRLDCTPVLIGSISLGLIQLIVIGLDIANKVDWLNDSHWPIYLPFLQFAFVALLMQYILGRVAQNHELKKSVSSTFESELFGFGEKQLGSPINQGKGLNNGDPPKLDLSDSSISKGLQNIALAHLLVTHILLWLMKLNSISLFQSVEQQQSLSTVLAQLEAKRLYAGQLSIQPQQQDPFAVSTPPPPPPVVDLSKEVAGGDNGGGQHQRPPENRTELEGMLRRRAPKANYAPLPQSNVTLVDPSTPPASSTRPPESVGTKVAPIVAGSSIDSSPISQPLEPAKSVHSSASTATRAPAAASGSRPELAVKSERALRSALQSSSSPPSSLSTESSKADEPLRLDQTNKLAPNLSSNSTSVTMTQAELINLLNLAAGKQRQSVQPPPLLDGSSTTFKSSLPKRMTAFRQAWPAARANASTADLQPKALVPATRSIVEPALIVIANPSPSPGSSSSSGLNQSQSLESKPSQHPKQRARIVISRQEEREHEVKFDDRRRQGKEGPSSTERPFPSVDSEPSNQIATTPSSRATSTVGPDGGHSKKRVIEAPEQRSKTKSRSVGKWSAERERKQEPKELNGDSEEESSSSSEDVSSDSEESDVDLDSLLPPVPNYNETEDESGTGKETAAPAGRADFLAAEGAKKAGHSVDEAFVFNEAASTLSLAEWAPSHAAPDGWDEPRGEALVMQLNSSHRQEGSQSTLGDYLMPIVHQYHILVIAVLFNMWLDSLRTVAPASLAERNSLQADKSHPSDRNLSIAFSSSASDLGSTSNVSSRRGVMAIPIGRNRLRAATASKLMGDPRPPLSITDRRHKGSQACGHHLSSSLESLHNTRHLEEASSTESASPSSLRSSSSEQLLWTPNSKLRARAKSPEQLASGKQTSHSPGSGATHSVYSFELLKRAHKTSAWPWTCASPEATVNRKPPTNSVCSVFFGLLVVSTSLIVILLGVDLLLVLSQILAQLISVLVCLLGLCLIWRSGGAPKSPVRRLARASTAARRILPGQLHLRGRAIYLRQVQQSAKVGLQAAGPAISHRQCFHYLFILAAYFCGISMALNLNKQHSVRELFSQQVIQFLQRLFSQTVADRPELLPVSAANYLFLFHLVLALKGLLLIVQVTLQTILIRSSCGRTSTKLRQVYTFLMFANLSLWAMEICEQQQRLLQLEAPDQFRVVTFEGVSRFAAAVVTLSHLYHGLVFMQH